MVIDASVTQLFGAGRAGSPQRPADLSRIANRQTANRMGIVEGDTPGGYRGVFSAGTKQVKEDVFETRNVMRKEDVYQDSVITEMRDVHATRDITETRDVYETRAIYEEREVYQSDVTVNGTRDLRSFNSPSNAGIDSGSDLKIKVGDNAAVEIQFNSGNRIAVTKNGQTTNFSYTSGNGSWRTALVNAFNSVGGGLSAAIAADGKLSLTANDSQSIQISDVANGLLDFSRSPIGALGLTAGTTNAQFLGYEQVQVGSEQVLVGTEQVVVGQEQYVAGQENVVVGYQRDKVGERDVIARTERVRVGSVTRTEVGERKLIGLEKSDDYGVGYLDILEKLASGGGLPAGYVDALFGRTDQPAGGQTPADAAPPAGAYAEADSFASRDEPATNRWSSFKAEHE